MDANGDPVKIIVTKGTTADCTKAIPLIKGIISDTLIADKAYDTNEIVAYAKEHNKEQREYDEYLHKLRHLVENAILKLKNFRGIATRYAKTTIAFHGTVAIACIIQWLKK